MGHHQPARNQRPLVELVKLVAVKGCRGALSTYFIETTWYSLHVGILLAGFGAIVPGDHILVLNCLNSLSFFLGHRLKLLLKLF